MLDHLSTANAEDGEHGRAVGNETNLLCEFTFHHATHLVRSVTSENSKLDELALQPYPAGLAPDNDVVVSVNTGVRKLSAYMHVPGKELVKTGAGTL